MKRLLTLENGTRVVFVPFQSAMDVGIAVAFRAGSGYETPAQSGLSHLLEHILGCHSRAFNSPLEQAQAFDDLTSATDASTSQTVMLFSYECKPKFVRSVITLAHNMLLRPRINRGVIDLELRRVREEESLGCDDPETALLDATVSHLHQGTNGSKPVLGTLEHLSSLRVRDVFAWYQQCIVGQRCAIAVAGAFNVGTVEKCVRMNFRTLRPGLPAPDIRVPRIRQRVQLTRHPSRSTYVSVGFVTPFGYTHPDRLVMSVIKNHLYDREASPIQLRLARETGLVYGTASAVRHHTASGYFYVRWWAHPMLCVESLQIVLRIFEEIASGSFTANDLHRAVTSLKVKARGLSYDAHGQAAFYVEQLLLTDDVVTPAQYCRALDQIRVRDVRRVAAQVLSLRNVLLTVRGPLPRNLARDVRALLRTS